MEKKVANNLGELGHEFYLPTYESLRQWHDRKKKITLPLFPNYVFVKLNQVERLNVFGVKGVRKFVSIEKSPVTIAENVITELKKIINAGFDIQQENFFEQGAEVKIVKGQLAGMQGLIMDEDRNGRVLIRIDSLVRAFSINVPVEHLEPAHC